ncbi:ROK family protein [Lacimicrobium alkaliphilum]|uniref:N-acetylglucosamine kinase n=1 Tax=Lacimicrobium alkaliphilum TaxID=1526571 RepID=A0A0U3B0A6_9ALTE|nr:ROK family protein [Lacimicrobium alkaliphilum]ALS98680.1 N-acetylglucosamine kinase [Lacimicrobium alkaliphilum]
MHYGLDIGGTKMEMAIFDHDFTLLNRWRVATPTQDYAAFIEQICAQISRADDFSASQGSIGIGMPGIQSADGKVLSSNVACLNGHKICGDLAKALQRPVAMANDCRCFTLSEARLGAGRGYHRVFGAILGTGAGGGLCIDGRLYDCANDLAGEFGHQGISARVMQKYDLPLYDCGCGLKGCAETYISGTGLARIYQHFSHQQADTYQWLDAYQHGDHQAIEAFNCYMDALGAVMANQVLAYDPDMIVLGGGISDIDVISGGLSPWIGKHLFPAAVVPRIEKAELGAASGVRGAALIGAQEQGI